MQIITLLDLPKISTNSIYAGVHWSARKKHKDNYLLLTNKMKRLQPVKGLVDIEFTFHFKSTPLDSSNCSYMAKILEDCLVKHGILAGDEINFVRKISLQSLKSKQERCEIIIREV